LDPNSIIFEQERVWVWICDSSHLWCAVENSRWHFVSVCWTFTSACPVVRSYWPHSNQCVCFHFRILSINPHNIEAIRLLVLHSIGQEGKYAESVNRLSELIQASNFLLVTRNSATADCRW